MRLNCLNAGNTVTLDMGKALGRGGEATVYALRGDPHRVAKLYHHPDAATAQKLRQMLAAPPLDPCQRQGHVSFTWPLDLLADPQKGFVGYLMPRLSGGHSFALVYHPTDRKSVLPAGFDYRYLLRSAANLANAVAAIHALGYVIGDLNDCNILVQPDARVTVIDCDSFQVGPYPCPVARPEYTAPELQGKTLGSIARTAQQDGFALAILIHLLLMRGYHPFAGVGGPSALEERIAVGLTPFSPQGPARQAGAPAPELLLPELKDLFVRAFVQGHRRPAERPSAQAWATALSDAESRLTQCSRDRSHLYFAHLSQCPLCPRTGKTRRGAPAQGQRPLASPRRSRWLRPALVFTLMGALVGLGLTLRVIQPQPPIRQVIPVASPPANHRQIERVTQLPAAASSWHPRPRPAPATPTPTRPLPSTGSEIYRQIMGTNP